MEPPPRSSRGAWDALGAAGVARERPRRHPGGGGLYRRPARRPLRRPQALRRDRVELVVGDGAVLDPRRTGGAHRAGERRIPVVDRVSAPMRIVVWFSCGATSAVAAKLALAEWRGKLPIRVVYCDPGSEHPDNRRFLQDVERWIDFPVE